MPPETDPGQGSGAAGAGQQSAGTTQHDPTGAGSGGGQQQQTGPDGKPWDPARAMATIETLRGFETKTKEQDKVIADLQTKLKEYDDAKLSETEKLQKSLSALEAEKSVWERERQEMRVAVAVREAAAKAGATYPDAVERLVNVTSIEFDADGAPKNIDKVLEGIKAGYPGLFGNGKPGSADGGARTASGGSDMDQIIRRAAGR